MCFSASLVHPKLFPALGIQQEFFASQLIQAMKDQPSEAGLMKVLKWFFLPRIILFAALITLLAASDASVCYIYLAVFKELLKILKCFEPPS